ncbi:chemotaxis protein CheW [Chitinilyticum piscinae]|uniref:Purine-binding chemotaxis protein CheW n=1 Tax=Chitinilyticum piscinae TaxID=2866724 RepID=A0A8J7G0D1_9NEIS|nr:chemotaxis protein CheW [Chitinilyticum piscinae]MBE9609650.1 purine-binding chemotaxis protein CheW [Chitinilyticum piscinae]
MSALTLQRQNDQSTAHAQAEHAAEVAQYLSFQLGGETFAMGILNIREILEYEYLTEVPLMPDFIRGVMNLRGAVVPVIDLALRFNRPRTELGRRSCVVIVEVDDPETETQQLIGILVDAVHEVLAISEQEIEAPPQFGSKLRTDFIAGMARVDNRFIVLLNVPKVLSVEEITLLASLREHPEGGGPGELPVVGDAAQ